MQQEAPLEESKEKTVEKQPHGYQQMIAKHAIKDSVFTSIFQDKKYLLQLYQALHPEDTETTEDALVDITTRNVLANGIYNDLGFRVGDKIVILVEAQSSWTMNIIIRVLLYLAQTYHDYFERQGVDLYSGRKVKIPRPELYVIYTGERASKPQSISLSEEFFGGAECAIEVKINVIYDGTENDIIHQYVTFTKVYNKQMKLYGRSREAILETIRICKNENVLREYLENREVEVVSMMMTLFDEERIIQNYVASERREAAEEAAAEAAAETAREAVKKMLKAGKMSVEEIAGYFTALSVKEVQEIEKEMRRSL